MNAFNLSTPLMEHQQKAVEKLMPTRVGALFMEMGTGKTLTAIELIRIRTSKIDKVVWFCPVSIKLTLQEEIKRHVPAASVYIFDESTSEEHLPLADWYIVGIESMSSSNRVVFAAQKLITKDTFVVLDESAYIKTPRAIRSRRIIELTKDTKYRLALTGTPMTKGLEDLYMQMYFLSPKILGYTSFQSFANNHLVYDPKNKDRVMYSMNSEWISAKINPYTYQVTKDECLDLPAKVYERTYTFNGDTYEQYQAVKAHYLNLLERFYDGRGVMIGDPSTLIFRMFSGLQKALSGYNFEEDEWTEPEMRLERLERVIEEIGNEHKVIVWCRFLWDVECVKKLLAAKYGEDSVAEFTGQLKVADRQKSIEQFRDNARFLVATPLSGGHGLTLNEASYVIYYTHSFDYAQRKQSEDRCHRIGQTKSVTYIDILAHDTIDTRIIKNIERKRDTLRDFREEFDKVKDDLEQARAMIEIL